MSIFDWLFGKKSNESGGKDTHKNKGEPKDNLTDKITCAGCKKEVHWSETYIQQDTPESTPYNPPGHGDTRPRIFCPHCGALLVDWHINRTKDFDEWLWFDKNERLNEKCSLPPSPFTVVWKRGIPVDFKASYAEHKIDINKIEQYYSEKESRREKALENAKNSNAEDSIDWSSIDNYYNYGCSLREQGDKKGAEKAFRLSIETTPKSGICYKSLSDILESQNRWDESIDVLNKSIDADPDYLIAYKSLSYTLIFLKRFEEAEVVYRKCMEIAPYHPITESIKNELDEKRV